MSAEAPRARDPGGTEATILQPGTKVGRYTVQKRLGKGSMGEVYLAVDEELGRRAALKVLGSRHLENATVKERFLREARALARLSHPNLITVYESGYVGTPPRPYYAMELLDGGDTQKLLEERGPLPSGVVTLIGAQAATGLGEAARARIIHRDVKPANLGISGQGVLKVTDFGLAKSYATEKSLTGKGIVVGTADYIAPEQARGEEVDERADVYALGCTLFHLLTGKPPFRSETGTEVQRYVEVMRAHLSAPVPDPRRLIPAADPELSSLIMALMIKDRDKRLTFDEAAPALGQLAARLGGELPRVTRRLFTLPTGTPVLGSVTPPPETVAPPAPATPAPSSSAPAPAQVSTGGEDRAMSRWARIAATVAIAGAAIAAAMALFGR